MTDIIKQVEEFLGETITSEEKKMMFNLVKGALPKNRSAYSQHVYSNRYHEAGKQKQFWYGIGHYEITWREKRKIYRELTDAEFMTFQRETLKKVKRVLPPGYTAIMRYDKGTIGNPLSIVVVSV